MVELGESLPRDYASDNAYILVSQKQHPGIHPELSGDASLTHEQLLGMLVTLGKRQTT